MAQSLGEDGRRRSLSMTDHSDTTAAPVSGADRSDAAIQPFHIALPQADLDDLQDRLARVAAAFGLSGKWAYRRSYYARELHRRDGVATAGTRRRRGRAGYPALVRRRTSWIRAWL
jgi:hypothetical protein